MTDNTTRSWLISVLLGSLLNISVFVLLPIIKEKTQDDDPVLVLEIQNWQPAVKKPVKEPKKIPKPKPKPKPRPRKPKIEKTVAQEVPPKDPTPSPEKTAKLEEPEQATPQEEPLPQPTPLFQLTELAQFVHKAELVYPEDMFRLGKEALVKLDVLIDARGRIRKISVYQSAGKSFDDAAMQAIQESSFTPARKKGKPVAMVLRVPISFNLR